jgi:hypothetical protein
MGTIVGILIFVGFTIGIWFSYRLFMRGDTAGEKVAALLPSDFKPDLWHRKGDTYVAYEKEKNRLVLVDWPHAKVLSPKEVLSLEPVHDTESGSNFVARNATSGLVSWQRFARNRFMVGFL